MFGYPPGTVVRKLSDPHDGLSGLYLCPLDFSPDGLCLVIWTDGEVERLHTHELRPIEDGESESMLKLTMMEIGLDDVRINRKRLTGETFRTDSGQLLVNVHRESDQCREHHCPVHNPSSHALSIGKLRWANEKNMMSRVCEHNYNHPDPDAQDWRWRNHGVRQECEDCCGCCKKGGPGAS